MGFLHRGGVGDPGRPQVWQSVTQLSNFWSSGVEVGASGPASLQGEPSRRLRGARTLLGKRGGRFRGFL